MEKYKVYRYLLLIWAGLVIFPSIIFINNTIVFPWLDLSNWPAQLLYLLTSTGTAPYAIGSVFIFWGISFKLMQKVHWQKMVLATLLSLLVSFTLNHSLKAYFEEPRPNFTWLSEQSLSPIELERFYHQSKSQRRDNVESALQQYRNTSDPQQLNTEPVLNIAENIQQHWVHEVGYAFPSGHTIFAITLVLSASFYLLLSNARVLTILMFVWGLGMGTSRMLLGMHWPQDVLASTCLAALISLLTITIIERIWERLSASRQLSGV